MKSLRSNLVKRIERLPKPSNVAGAMQPLFEAISNAIHSTQSRFDDQVSAQGKITVTISTNRKKNIRASIEDNGIGLNAKNWDAFTTTDTDHKILIGGKGVGRLMWLDCFEDIKIRSVHKENDGTFFERKFSFKLEPENQIQDLSENTSSDALDSGLYITFSGIRDNGYREKFPGRDSFIFQHIVSHFLPTFIGSRSPQITVHVGDDTRHYPDSISDIVHRKETQSPINTVAYGNLNLTLMECDKTASSDMKGKHFVHFIAHDRTVHSQSIDGKLGLAYFGSEGNRVFHAIVTGEFLDKNVNQERTAFIFEDSTINDIITDVCFEKIEDFLSEPLKILKNEQRSTIESITSTYPSVSFGSIDELQNKVPSGELNADAIYGHLARERFRRDERQAEKIKNVLTRLKESDINIEDFSTAIKDASAAIEDAEQKSLAEYILRRKVVLDFIEILLQKVRDDTQDSSYQREDILHSFICPLRIQTVADNKSKVEPATSHDLWIIDERLTFAQYFSSDVEFSTLSASMNSTERPDILIFDYVHGLRQTDEPSKVLLVEFKRPGRKNYSDDENPQFQIERYINRLQGGSLCDVKGRPIVLHKNTIFYCYIVADIIGNMDRWTYSWQKTADGRGRIYTPNSGFRGSIELMGWDQLINDARARNQAFFDKAGISGNSIFSSN